jgi:hypothetical protein
MKNKSSNPRGGRSYDFFRQPMNGRNNSDTLPELIKPESERERTESVMKDILRWADDGGQMLDIGNALYPSNAATAGKAANE